MCCYILKQIMCSGEEGVESHRGKLSHPSFPAKERAGTSKFWCKNISVASIQINILIDFFSQGHWLSDTTLIFCQADLGYIVTIEGVGARRYQVTILSIWDNRHFYIIQIVVLLMLLFMADDTLVFVYFMHESRIGYSRFKW